MSEGRYNIPKQYRVEKGMPVELLNQRIENQKCRQIFDTEIESMTWCYQITDNDKISDVQTLMRARGISVFEVVTRSKVSPELMTEVISSLIPKRFIVLYLSEGELSIGTYIPSENGMAAKMCVTDFYPYDSNRMIEILDYEKDTDKSIEEIHKRFLSTVRYQRKMIMIEKAFESIKNKPEPEPEREISLEIREEELNRIREDAEYVREQLRVEYRV